MEKGSETRPILVTSYFGPDLDGAGGAWAYAELLNTQGRPAVAGTFGSLHLEARFVFEKLTIPLPISLEDSRDFDAAVLVDCGRPQTELVKRLSPEKVIEIIDHHDGRDSHVFINAKVQIEPVGAAATLVAERFLAAKLKPSPHAAALLYAGIASNTLNFAGKVTTNRDRDAAAAMSAACGLGPEFIKEMFIAKSNLAGPRLLEVLEGDFAEYASVKFGIGQLEVFGARELLKNRRSEISAGLSKMQKESGLEYIFLNILNLEEGNTLVLADDKPSQKLLSELFGLKFENGLAVKEGLILRKEYFPVIKDKLRA